MKRAILPGPVLTRTTRKGPAACACAFALVAALLGLGVACAGADTETTPSSSTTISQTAWSETPTSAAPLVITTSTASTESTTTTTARPDPETLARRRVVTEFFYWYDPVTGAHMDAEGPLTLHPPEGRTPSWRDPAWFKAECADMAAAGIDIAACSYWPQEAWADKGLVNLVAALDELTAEGADPPGVVPFYETTYLWDQDLTTPTGRERFYEPVKRFYSQIPREHWGLIEDRPAVWFYDTGRVHAPTYDDSTFAHLYDTFTADFGVRPYVVVDKSWLDNHDLSVDGTYTWGVAFLGFHPRDSVAGAGPGYDDHLVPGRDSPIVVDRAGGAWYERNLYYALASGAQVLWLETWNEHHEATNIDETAEYGRTYIEITRRYVDMFKKGDVPAQPGGAPFSESETVTIDAAALNGDVTPGEGATPESGGPVAGEGLTLLSLGAGGGDGGWELIETTAGPAWTTTGEGEGRYLYFAIADGFAFFDTPVTVDVGIEYLDVEDPSHGYGELQIQYDSFEPGRPPTLADRYRPVTINPIRNSGEWYGAVIRLQNVRFANGQNGGADFRLWTGSDQDLTVRKVTVTKVTP